MKGKWGLLCVLVMFMTALPGCPHMNGQTRLQGTWSGLYHATPYINAYQQFSFDGDRFSMTGAAGVASGTFVADSGAHFIDFHVTSLDGEPCDLYSYGVYRIVNGTLCLSESLGDRPYLGVLEGLVNVFIGTRIKSEALEELPSDLLEGLGDTANADACDSLMQLLSTPAH